MVSLVVRELAAGDEAPLIKLGREMWEESANFNRHPLNEEKLKQLALAVYTSDFLACFIASNDKGPQGIWVGGVHPLWYSDDLSVHDIVFYVRKQYRGSSAALKLVKSAEKWGQSMGASEINIGLSSGIDTEKTSCFFNKLSYMHNAVQMTKELNNVL